MKKNMLSRRSFAVRSAFGASAVAFPFVSVRNVLGANERLNIAGIGCGGKGATDVAMCGSQNIVALVDIDPIHGARMFQKFPEAKRYQDYRVMFDEMVDKVDAVTISTPDHMHFHPAMRAVLSGKHVFCQKPLTHTVWEARTLTLAARKAGVATQMGNQGISAPKMRRDAEVVKSGALGEIKELHCWTDRPGGRWKQGIGRPAGVHNAPDHIDWDLWIGCAPWRPYHPAYHPFAWRGFWDFGTGAIGDMGCHLLNLATLTLDIRDPEKIVAEGRGQTSETGPTESHIVWDFPKREGRSAFKFHWYDGGRKPSQDLFPGAEFDTNGIIMIGEADTMLTHYSGGGRLKSGRKYADLEVPDMFGECPSWHECHYDDWINACKGGSPALSNFEKAGPVTEVVLLGQVALRAGTEIKWDADRMEVSNNKSANQYVSKAYRKGWEI
ncbi:MAG: Gfo/Idh/MocA family protein [Verrucomicrobiota bacterium]|jgi:predicted dehydrogenase